MQKSCFFVVAEFMDKHALAAEMEIYFDDADCDGCVLGQDCNSAAIALENVLQAIYGTC